MKEERKKDINKERERERAGDGVPEPSPGVPPDCKTGLDPGIDLDCHPPSPSQTHPKFVAYLGSGVGPLFLRVSVPL